MGITDVFNIFVFQPLYNALVFIADLVPGHNIGISIIVLTILVKILILPLSHKSTKTQAKLRELEPEIKKIKDKHKKNQQDQARAIMSLYKEHGINPFSGCILTLIQIPVIFGLYWVFWRGLGDGVIDPTILYSFIDFAGEPNFGFLGLDLGSKSVILSFLAGVTQYMQMKLAFPPRQNKKEEKNTEKGSVSFGDELKKSMTTQAKYILPFVIGVVSLSFPAAIPLYWSTSNIFSIGHELLVKRKVKQML
jgi:YidC/Oxa1 family membrane protein insertase